MAVMITWEGFTIEADSAKEALKLYRGVTGATTEQQIRQAVVEELETMRQGDSSSPWLIANTDFGNIEAMSVAATPIRINEEGRVSVGGVDVGMTVTSADGKTRTTIDANQFAVDDGWIDWDGNGSVPEGLKMSDYVQVRLRNGGAMTERVDVIDWSYSKAYRRGIEVVSYRKITEPAQPDRPWIDWHGKGAYPAELRLNDIVEVQLRNGTRLSEYVVSAIDWSRSLTATPNDVVAFRKAV